jgi:hypothetical protein
MKNILIFFIVILLDDIKFVIAKHLSHRYILYVLSVKMYQIDSGMNFWGYVYDELETSLYWLRSSHSVRDVRCISRFYCRNVMS